MRQRPLDASAILLRDARKDLLRLRTDLGFARARADNIYRLLARVHDGLNELHEEYPDDQHLAALCDATAFALDPGLPSASIESE